MGTVTESVAMRGCEVVQYWRLRLPLSKLNSKGGLPRFFRFAKNGLAPSPFEF
jgi:hypothetical protein